MINEKNIPLFDDSDSARKAYVREQVSRLTGVPVAEVSLDELVKFISAAREAPYTNSPWLVKMYQKYLGISTHDLSWVEDSTRRRRMSEINQGLSQYAELLMGEEIISLSYGTAAPTYIEQLEKFKNFFGDKPCKSLLVGALTLDTINEYESLTKTTLPQAKTFVIDLAGYETRQAKNFSLGDGLNLPYADGSFDILQTNYLMHSLVDDFEIGLSIAARRAFFSETYRVLKPGGLLLMVEGNHETAIPLAPDYLVKPLYKKDLTVGGGYSRQNIEIKSAKLFTTRKDMHRFFHDPESHVTDFETTEDPGCLVITAWK